MNIIGVVAEFNPFHKGHKYLIDKIHDLYHPDCIVVAMSGNFVQRGEAAIFDKWVRAEMALISGVDVVVQIPEFFCLSDAGTYAKSAVKILSSMGAKTICYGSESGLANEINELVDFYISHQSEILDYTNKSQLAGNSFPKARQEAFYELMQDNSISTEHLGILSCPNDTLGFEYSIAARDYNICCVPIKRLDYGNDLASASQIRSLIYKEQDVSSLVPEELWNLYSETKFSKLDDKTMLNFLRYRIISDASNPDDVPSGGEGLGCRFKNTIETINSIQDLILGIKSKQITYTRASRFIMQNLLGFQRYEFSAKDINYTRLLGFRESASAFFKELKHSDNQKFHIINNYTRDVSKLSGQGLKLFESDIKSAKIYNLITNGDIPPDDEIKRHAKILAI